MRCSLGLPARRSYRHGFDSTFEIASAGVTKLPLTTSSAAGPGSARHGAQCRLDAGAVSWVTGRLNNMIKLICLPLLNVLSTPTTFVYPPLPTVVYLPCSTQKGGPSYS